MEEIRRWISKKNIYVIIISAILCVMYFVISNIGATGITQFNTDNTYYKHQINSIAEGNLTEDISSEIADYAKYINSYSDSVYTILQKAETVKALGAFTSDTYSILNIDKTYNDYMRVKDTKLTIVNTKGFEEYIKFIPFISFFIVVIVIYYLFDMQKEYDNGEVLFTYSMQNGRCHLAVKRNIIFTMMIMILTLIFNTVLLLVSYVMYGAMNMTVPVQCSMMFSDCTYVMSTGVFFIINTVLISLGISSVVMVSQIAFNVVRNKYISICIIGGFILVEWRLSLLVQNNSLNRLLSNINIYRFVDFSTYYSNYQNIKFFGKPYSAVSITIITMFIIYIFGFIVSAFTYSRRYPYAKNVLAIFNIGIGNTIRQFVSHCNYVGIEVYKLLIRKGRWCIVVMLVVLEIMMINGTHVQYADRQQMMDEVYLEYGGSDWQRFEQYVTQYSRSIEQLETKLANLIPSDEYIHIEFEKQQKINELTAEKKNDKRYLKNIRKSLREKPV